MKKIGILSVLLILLPLILVGCSTPTETGPSDTSSSTQIETNTGKPSTGTQKVDMFHVQILDELFPKNNLSYDLKKGKKVVLPSIKESNEYSFLGWFYQDNGIEKKFSPDTIIENDIIIYAKWEAKTMSDVLNAYIDHLLDTTTGYIPSWNQESFKGRWNYIDGVFLNSVVELYHQTKQNKYKNFLIQYINYYIDENGNFINTKDPLADGFNTQELDSICESRILFDAYEMTNDDRYLKAIERTYQALMAMPKAEGSPNFWHKVSYPHQIWLDGMYMYVPFYARYALLKDKPEIFDEIKSQYEYIRNHAFDEGKKLYYHGHDTTKSIFWANDQTGNSSSFWLRSMGWYLVSLVDVLPYFPEGSNKIYLTELLKEALEGVLQYQDSTSKMFFQLIDLGPQKVLVGADYLKALQNKAYLKNGEYVDAEISNYLESSGSSMIAYCLIKGAKKGYIDSSFKEKGKFIFEGIYKHSFADNCLNDICITAGLGPEKSPYRDGTPEYYLAEKVGSNDAKGVGPFLMAYLEYTY